jgi:hypothetical protein
MVRLTQELLRPGAYRLAGGRTGRLTRENLLELADATRSVMAAGYEIPVLKRHAAKGAPHGGPRKAGQDLPQLDVPPEVQRVGRVAEISLHDDGSLHQVLEIDDEASASDFQSGAVRHTSAELRPAWTDDEGVQHGPIVAHVALTQVPRHSAQPPAEILEEAVQFSLEEIEGVSNAAELATIRAQVDAAQIPAGLRQRIWETLAARQFSASDEPMLALGDVLSMLESGLPPQWRQSGSALSAPHREGEAFFTGEELSDERAEQIAREQLRRSGLDR